MKKNRSLVVKERKPNIFSKLGKLIKDKFYDLSVWFSNFFQKKEKNSPRDGVQSLFLTPLQNSTLFSSSESDKQNNGEKVTQFSIRNELLQSG